MISLLAVSFFCDKFLDSDTLGTENWAQEEYLNHSKKERSLI